MLLKLFCVLSVEYVMVVIVCALNLWCICSVVLVEGLCKCVASVLLFSGACMHCAHICLCMSVAPAICTAQALSILKCLKPWRQPLQLVDGL